MHAPLRFLRVLVPVSVVALAAACGSDTAVGPPAVASVAVTPGTDTLVALGRTRQFTAQVLDSRGAPVSATVVWRSSNPGVATVDSVTGVVTAVGNGLSVIRASAGGITGLATLAVAQVVAGVVVTPGSKSFTAVGDTQRFAAVAKDSGGGTVTGVRFLWGSSNPAVATVDTLGLATARGSGQTTISATGRGVPGYGGVAVNQVATRLVFVVPPTLTVAGEAINPAVQVEVRDSAGNLVTGSRAAITVAFGSHPGGAVLHGSTTVNAVGGVATFSGLTIEMADSQYTITAASSGMLGAASGLFAVVPAAVGRLVIQVPDSGVNGLPLTPAPTVTLYDRFGNFAWNRTDTARLDVVASTWRGHLAGNTSAVSVGGVATFPNVRLSSPGSFTLRARVGASEVVAPPMVQQLHFKTIATGFDHSCGIAIGFTVFCWGANQAFQLGNGSTDPDSVPTLVKPSVSFSTVVVGQSNTCGLTAAGETYCWGNDWGYLDTVPTLVPGGQTFASLSLGADDICGLTAGGAAYCWGLNYHGATGDSTTNPSLSPVAVHGGHTFTAIAVGADFTCGIATGGAGFCWGYNTSGQLGNGTTDSALVPTPVSGGLTFSALRTGNGHACGLVSGAARCWGSNFAGQTGDTLNPMDSVPIAVTGGHAFATIVPGSVFTCAIALTGQTYCWGDNFFGELGSAPSSTPVPTLVTGGISFASIASGNGTTCGLTGGGKVYCWGKNDAGSVGDGSSINRSTPTAVVQ
jgi:alpha-tubulin suppressor-like RCC1 family protein